ncbi:MAG: hypothetical protein AB8C02_00625 [Halioglobus sp.]
MKRSILFLRLIQFSGISLKAIVHIGTEKTGTTSIQSFLYQNRFKLSEQGFHFLQCAGKTNNRALPSYCLNNDREDDYFRTLGITSLEARIRHKKSFIEALEKELSELSSDTRAVIISSEHFHSRITTENEMDNVRELLSTYFGDIEIICYLRDQVSTCTSYYSTVLKSGDSSSFVEFVEHCKPKNYYFNYWKMLKNWERCFGFEALNVSLFSREKFLNGNLLDDFTAKIDPLLVGLLDTDVKNENESLNPSGQALLRGVNLAFPIRSLRPELEPLRKKCQLYISQRYGGRGMQLSPKSYYAIRQAFAQGNEAVRQQYFPNEAKILEPPVLIEKPESIELKYFLPGFEALLTILVQDGRDLLNEDEFTGICNILFSTINELLYQHGEMKMLNTLSDQDAVLLRNVATQVEEFHIPAADRLVHSISAF